MVQKGKGFQIFAQIIMILLVLFSLIPFVLLFMSSITEEKTLIVDGYSFFPRQFSTYAYSYLFSGSNNGMIRAYGISFLITFLGTILNVSLTTLFAYPLSRKELPGRNFFAFFLFFTMLFSGGLVPSYIMWTRTFHIQNTLFALLVPNLMLSAFNVIMMRTYLTGNIPDAVIEAARIEGAGEFRILFSVVLPMAKPILATVALLVGLGYWNDWTNGLYYIVQNKDIYNIQNLLNNMVQNIQYLAQSSNSNVSGAAAAIPTTGVQMAIAFVAILPIMLIFPTFSKYYSKGIALGAVKG